MLRIRFSRTGKKGQPSYRIVVAEHRAPVKGLCIENLGYYLPARKPKIVSLKKERITYWISKGAIPTDTAASLFKKEGFLNMEKYLEPRNKQRKKKSEEAQKTSVAPAPKTPAPAPVAAKAAPAAAPAVPAAPAPPTT
ncbi:30S ribosomal protein S16 [Candidatus Peregrinibacteria bacterium]|nr:30S ribosomal protein S16 [Candidatus Peregrinibacteria bacterium]